MIIIFRSPSLEVAFGYSGRICDLDFGPVSNMLLGGFCISEVQMLLSAIPVIGVYAQLPAVMAALVLSFCMLISLVCDNAYEKMQRMKPSLMPLLFSVFLLTWCVFSFGKVSEFLYFNF